MSEPVKAYLTKYVCASGKIDEIEVWDNEDGYAVQRVQYRNFYKWDRDIFRTQEAAVTDALNRRSKKVASLKKQIAKLEAMSFL